MGAWWWLAGGVVRTHDECEPVTACVGGERGGEGREGEKKKRGGKFTRSLTHAGKCVAATSSKEVLLRSVPLPPRPKGLARTCLTFSPSRLTRSAIFDVVKRRRGRGRQRRDPSAIRALMRARLRARVRACVP